MVPFSRAVLTAALLAPACCSLSAITLQVDFDSGNTTQAGWESLAASDNALGSSWSKAYPGGIGIDVDALGVVSLDQRDRGNNNGGGIESAMWRDFLFANGSFARNPGSGLRVSITGLTPNSTYPIRLWGWDESSNGNRRADWSGGGSGPITLAFPDSPDPSSLSDYSITLDCLTDNSGSLRLSGVVAASSPSSSHNVFLNGLEIGNVVSVGGPTDISPSNTMVAKTAPIGTLVGTLSTTDPTPGDLFVYSLVGGVGSGDNGNFTIMGDRLETDRDLSALTGPLSVRIRSTDQGSNWTEKSFLIELVDDSDFDGLIDTWELAFFGDLTTATGSDHHDADSLTDLEEQSLGSSPLLADTDGDGLNDDLENGTGIFNGASDPGSSPILTDTDGDALNDALEVSLSNGHVTNPNLADSDGDSFSDPVEITEGTNPNNPGDFPNILIPLVLNEIMAANNIGLRDGYDTREDWIEIYNPNPGAVNLDNYFLTDNPQALITWNFPNVTIPGNGYLVVFASGINQVDPAGNPHTNFKLDSMGEYLAIVRPNGTTIDDVFTPSFPEQLSDISYGPQSTDGQLRFFDVPTPGSPNGIGYPGVVKDTNFDVDRGFYDQSFSVTITSTPLDAAIRYTTDGSLPSPTTGRLYTGPVTIRTTTSLRAIAYKPGWLSTNVDTQTYIFVNKVAVQPSNPPGWPADWSNSGDPSSIHPADYEMDPRVVNNTLPGYSVPEALLDIPSISIAMEPADFLNSEAQPPTGIYSNPASRFERPCSIEYIRPDGVPGFQYDAKIEVHGNASRRPARMHKHSLRVTFTTEFGGPGRLEYPLFPDSPVDQFNKLVLRACFTDSWGLVSWSSRRYRPNDSQYFRDVWMKDSMRDMGQPSSHGNFVHLYVNGLYFGLHNLAERLEDDFFAEHLGGEKADWEINKDLSGGGSRWNRMMSIANGNISSNTAYNSIKNYLEVANFADYMLLHFYADSEDWPHHNGYAAANLVSGDGRFRFWVWDQEIVLDKYSWNRYGNSSGAGAPFQRLRLNEEFRLLFADRVQKHLFHGGALSEQASIDRYLGLANQIDKAIVAESARWGDTQASTPYGNTPGSSNNIDGDYYPPTINNPIYFTREQHWVVERDNVVNNYIPTLHNLRDSRSIIRELRSNNLYPSMDAPEPNQFGGVVPHGFELDLSGQAGAIYYTLDGSDPRLEGGSPNPTAGSLGTGVTTDSLVSFEASGWRYLDTGVGQSASNIVVGHGSYNSSDWKHPSFAETGWGTGQGMLGGDTVSDISGETLSTIVDIGPAGARYPTVYFRKSFTVGDAASYTSLTASVKRDDGAIVYLNGRELGRTNMAGGTVLSSNFATNGMSGGNESAINPIAYQLNAGDLVDGTNVLAVEVHQSSAGSGDLGIDVQVTASKPAGPPMPVILTQSATLKARILNAGEWSALTEVHFIVGTPAATDNLVVSELIYNPIGASEDSEYIEFMNISATEAINLTDVHFDAGITYVFPAGFVLGPLERVVIVKNQTVFAATYPIAGVRIAPGQYSGSLSNNGEEIAVQGQDDLDILRFTYSDNVPWPTSPDGLGFALVLVAPESAPDHSLAANWRASVALGGSPGDSDAVPFVGDPNADGDQDGLSAFFEHAMARSDADPSDGALITLGMTSFDDGSGPQDYLKVSYTRNLAADDALFAVEQSTDLQAWTTLQVELVSIVNHGDGTATYSYRSAFPFGSHLREFLRLQVRSRP